MKTLMLFVCLCLSFSTLAEEETCSFINYKYQGELQLALIHVKKISKLLSEGTKIKTDRSILLLDYWPNLHADGINELKNALEECPAHTEQLTCELVKVENHQELKLSHQDGSVVHTIGPVKGVPMKKVLEDFQSTGMCHLP